MQMPLELNLGFEKRMDHWPAAIDCEIRDQPRWAHRARQRSEQMDYRRGRTADVQRLRSRMSAVLTGIDTVLLADDPQLNVRDPSIDMLGRQPPRVVLDSRLRMPADRGDVEVAAARPWFSPAPFFYRGRRGMLLLSRTNCGQAGADIVAAESG